MGLGRFELPTSPLSGVRSNQLSYRPDSTAPAGNSRHDAQAALNRALSKGFEDTVERAIAARPLLTIGVDLTDPNQDASTPERTDAKKERFSSGSC